MCLQVEGEAAVCTAQQFMYDLHVIVVLSQESLAGSGTLSRAEVGIPRLEGLVMGEFVTILN